MKSNIACFISATHAFIEKHGANFNGQLSFIITGDEEKDAINGTPKMMEWTKQNNIIFDQCIVGELTHNTLIKNNIILLSPFHHFWRTIYCIFFFISGNYK